MNLFFSDDEILCQAYKLYLQEVERHIEDISYLLNKGKGLTGEDKQTLLITLHTMKGGAGFFQLDAIREIIKKMEHILSSSSLPLSPSSFSHLTSEFTSFKGLIEIVPRLEEDK